MKALITAAMVIGAALSGTAAIAKTTWNLPTGYSENNYHTKNLHWFADEVKKATNGEIEIIVHANATLYKVPEIKRAIQSGQVPIGDFVLSINGNEDPIFEPDMLPFLASGLDRARLLYVAQKPLLDQRFAKQGLRLLYSVPWPGNGIFSKEKMESRADFKGAKFRTYNSITARLAEGLGAQPTTVQVPELAQAFMSGIATVMIAAASIGVDTKAWEYTKYFYNANAFHPRSVVLVNERAFSRLPKDQQAVIIDIAAKAETRGWALCEEEAKSAVETLAANGLRVSPLSTQMRNDYEQVSKTIIADWMKRAGADGEKIMEALR